MKVFEDDPQCWLAQFSDKPCDGELVRCHLVSRQIIRRGQKKGRKLADQLADPRGWVWGCGGPMGNGGHHGMLDHSRTLRVPYEALPASLFEFADELGLLWWLEREYGRSAA